MKKIVRILLLIIFSSAIEVYAQDSILKSMDTSKHPKILLYYEKDNTVHYTSSYHTTAIGSAPTLCGFNLNNSSTCLKLGHNFKNLAPYIKEDSSAYSILKKSIRCSKGRLPSIGISLLGWSSLLIAGALIGDNHDIGQATGIAFVAVTFSMGWGGIISLFIHKARSRSFLKKSIIKYNNDFGYGDVYKYIGSSR
jgi:hypothetical protein